MALALEPSTKFQSKVCLSTAWQFKILAKARTASHLRFLGAIFYASRYPVLCSQKLEFVHSLALFLGVLSLPVCNIGWIVLVNDLIVLNFCVNLLNGANFVTFSLVFDQW